MCIIKFYTQQRYGIYLFNLKIIISVRRDVNFCGVLIFKYHFRKHHRMNVCTMILTFKIT